MVPRIDVLEPLFAHLSIIIVHFHPWLAAWVRLWAPGFCVLRVLALEGCPEFFCFDGLLKNSEAFLKEASSSQFGHRFGETGDLGGNLYIVKAIDDALGYFYEISEALCAFESYLKRGRRAPGGVFAFSGLRVRIVLDGDEPLAEDTELDLARKGIEGTF